MNKKVKLIIGIIYLTCFGLLLYGFFTFFDVGQLTSFSYIKENTKILIELKNQI